MDFREMKMEIMVVAGAMGLLFGVLSMLKGVNGPSQIETADIVYEMPRPVNSEFESEFALGEREIIRNHIALEKAKAAAAAKDKNKKVASAPRKKTAEDTKKLDAATKKKQFAVNVVQRAHAVMSRASMESTPDYTPAHPYVAPRRTPAPPVKDEEEKEKKDVMTYEEWRTLLASAPTSENMEKLVTALRDKDIESNDFYRLVQELLVKKEKEPQAAALYALMAVPNVTSFSLVAKHLDNLTAENRQTGGMILLSYTQPSYLPVLAQALRVNDFVVVKRAAEAINVGLDRAKNGQPVRDPRVVRGEPSATSSVQPFSRFVPIFQQWRASGDNNLVGLAETFLTRWQS